MITRNIKSRSFKPDPQRNQDEVRSFLANCCNIPDKYLKCTLEGVEGPEGEKLRRWFDWYAKDAPYRTTTIKRISGLLLSGKFGFGKTSAAIATARQIVLHGASVWFERELSLTHSFRDPEHRHKIENSWILILDDVGASEDEQWGRRADTLEEIIRFRMDVNLPTIITTNLNREELKEKLASIYTILGAYYTPIEFKTKNWRRDEAKECRLND